MSPDEYFRDLHLFELNRRNSYNGALNLPMGLMTLVGGATFSFSSRISIPFDITEWIAVLLLSCTLLLLAAAGWEVWKVAINKGYDFPAYAGDAKKHLQKIRDWISYRTEEGLSDDAEFLDALTEEFIRCAHANAKINDCRDEHSHRLKKRILLSLVTLALSGLMLGVTEIFNSASS